MDICVTGIAHVKRKKEQNSSHWSSGSDVDVQLCTVCQTPGTEALLLQFSLFSRQRAAMQALCVTLSKQWFKHTWERQGAGAGHPQLLTRALVLAGFQSVFQGTG